MRFEKVLNGILKYLDAEIYGGMNDWQELVARMAVTRIVRNSDNVKNALANNAFVRTFAIIDGDGNVDVDGLIQDLRDQIAKKGKITIAIPMLGTFSFNSSDIDKLQRMITEA